MSRYLLLGEFDFVLERNEEARLHGEAHQIRQEDIPFTMKFRSTFSHFQNHPLFQGIVPEKLDDCIASIDKIHNRLLPSEDADVQNALSDFFGRLFSEKAMLRTAISCLDGSGTDLRAYVASSLSNTVLKEFPNGKLFSKIDKNPSVIYHNGEGRKEIILMAYFEYCYRWTNLLLEQGEDPDLNELNFYQFVDDVNNLLGECHLAPLYPANQFDFLILLSVREFSLIQLDPDGGEPTEFLNRVLRFSFGDPEEDDAED